MNTLEKQNRYVIYSLVVFLKAKVKRMSFTNLNIVRRRIRNESQYKDKKKKKKQ